MESNKHTCKPPLEGRYAQAGVWGQDWTTGHDQREERDGCQHGQRHLSEFREMTNGQSQSPLKNILQRERDESDVSSVCSLSDPGFVNLGSTRPASLPRGFRVFGTRAPTVGNS